MGTLSTVFCCSIGVLMSAVSPTPGPLVGRAAPSFTLKDYRGKEVSLADFADAKVLVIVFLGTECPMVKLYAARLDSFEREVSERGVRLVGINSNCQDSVAEIAQFAREHRLDFPILKDAGSTVADAFGATRTPEAFVLDARRIIRYHGPIDDQFVVGTQKAKVGRRDLAIAVDELLSGKEVSRPELPFGGCLIGRPTRPDEQAAVTYSRQIARILDRRCVDCHRAGEIAPFALTSYEEARDWGATIAEVVDNGRMPPWFASPEHGQFANDMRLSNEEKQQVQEWVRAGCPRGDSSELPPARRFVDGWNIPQPDLVLPMRDRPFRVPAEGVVPYKHFVIDPGFTEDKWVVASEARPGNRAVVHHILVFLKAPNDHVELLRGSLLAAYAPGMPPRLLPAGMAKKIPAGSKIILQIHYTTNGTACDDLSSLGLVFCDAKDVRQQLESGWATNFLLAIPPNAPSHPVYATYVFKDDRLLNNLTPHMHMRGKSFRYVAEYPDGRSEILLDVPRYDFNWQLEYEFTEPKFMPKGTRLRCLAHYDNSAANLSNPDPNKWVTFGEQTWDEMMIGFFTAATLPKAKVQ